MTSVQIIFAKTLGQFVSQLVPSLACYDGWGIVRPETMAGGTFLSLQTLHHDTSLRDIDYCYILSVTLMAFLRSHLDPRPLYWTLPLYLSWLLKNDSIETNCIVLSLFMNVLVLQVLSGKCNNAVMTSQAIRGAVTGKGEIHWAVKSSLKAHLLSHCLRRWVWTINHGCPNILYLREHVPPGALSSLV